MNIFWFRRDLRLEDNHGLYEALSSGEVLPVFIFDESILGSLALDDARVSFIYKLLEDIQDQLSFYDKKIALFKGNPIEIFKQLAEENEIDTVYCNKDYEPFAIKRDREIETSLLSKGMKFKSFKDQVIFEEKEVVKDDQTPYLVFTPYSKKWKHNFDTKMLAPFNSLNLIKHIVSHNYPFISLSSIGFKPSNISVLPHRLDPEIINHYEETRNFPALDHTTYLSPHLRFGSISVRQVLTKIIASGSECLLNELIWREFFMQILWHFPESSYQCFHKKYEAIVWRNDENEFERWKQGTTGFPIVDAGMRQLNATGYMHNRVRMITAGFLCKHLLIDWRWGEAYFAEKLLDYDLSANVGNWQWAAGTGVDAAPYFRIFNPIEQVKKFDKELLYIKKWVPELDTFDYPAPIVEHSTARARCLAHYKKYLEGE